MQTPHNTYGKHTKPYKHTAKPLWKYHTTNLVIPQTMYENLTKSRETTTKPMWRYHRTVRKYSQKHMSKSRTANQFRDVDVSGAPSPKIYADQHQLSVVFFGLGQVSVFICCVFIVLFVGFLRFVMARFRVS